ncbi:hypothetical protein IW140_004360 [Coemansia sp. RSA 1813]|nr:hypothetical protein EV178_004431 [Coemansia sp. RSA 1646]KAJ1768455.1 hypothetical protein LPJ74_004844 [Coemansia sp. RSA 1843]KAJ2087918.1 hypothetical protein IW138_004616 [Coemansia sp. RSA 986]KAJ2212886.1 hypothetical protein EV179_004287 [Coemansia sp. RSA 487]KAJ2567657.1 hypothetical protein IW140_004360 [Coemansia sp. RSA 1813]
MWRCSIACYRMLAVQRPIPKAISKSTCLFRQNAIPVSRISRAFSAACTLGTESKIERERRRQQVQDDEREDIAEHGRQSIEIDEHREAEAAEDNKDDVAPEIERLDPQSIPELYPEFNASDQQRFLENEDHEHQLESEEIEGDDSWYVDPNFAQAEGTDEANVPLWQRRAAENLGRPRVDVSEFMNGSMFDMCCAVLRADAEIKVVDVSDRCDWTSRMVVAEAKSTRHMRAMTESLFKAIKDRNRQRGAETDTRVDGKESDDWVVVDMGHFVVHVMTPEARKLYDLESLWESEPLFEADEQTAAEEDEKKQ